MANKSILASDIRQGGTKIKYSTIDDVNAVYADACNEYIRRFCKKQSLPFDGWVGDIIGGMASFGGEYNFQLLDIIYDLQTMQERWNILKWQEAVIEFNISRNSDPIYINYRSYCDGMDYTFIKEQNEAGS